MVGYSTALEKDYFRLTSMPTLGAVRAPAVLQRALAMVQRHWLAVRLFRDFYFDLAAHPGRGPAPAVLRRALAMVRRHWLAVRAAALGRCFLLLCVPLCAW